MIGRNMLKTDRFPGGKHFAVTFSYDDGNVQDKKLLDILQGRYEGDLQPHSFKI